LLFEISSVFFVNQDQVQEIFHWVLVMNILHWWCQIKWWHVQSNRDNFSLSRAPIHHFIFSYCFILSLSCLTLSYSFSSNNSKFHIFDFDSYKQKVNFSHHTVLQMEFVLLIFKFNMKTFFNSDFHFNSFCLFCFNCWHENSNIVLFCYLLWIVFIDGQS